MDTLGVLYREVVLSSEVKNVLIYREGTSSVSFVFLLCSLFRVSFIGGSAVCYTCRCFCDLLIT